jgi:hypothetical protein
MMYFFKKTHLLSKQPKWGELAKMAKPWWWRPCFRFRRWFQISLSSLPVDDPGDRFEYKLITFGTSTGCFTTRAAQFYACAKNWLHFFRFWGFVFWWYFFWVDGSPQEPTTILEWSGTSDVGFCSSWAQTPPPTLPHASIRGGKKRWWNATDTRRIGRWLWSATLLYRP